MSLDKQRLEMFDFSLWRMKQIEAENERQNAIIEEQQISISDLT